uniref:RRM domain-containing protein n=1 Tax=Cyanistes caeruleus TaxID=156563 RepID=A0A8C0ZFA6_CYACU
MFANAETHCATTSFVNSQSRSCFARRKNHATVLVSGIYLRVNEAEIWNFFKLYNTVCCDVKVVTDRTGVSKGYGFVSFLDHVDKKQVPVLLMSLFIFHDS